MLLRLIVTDFALLHKAEIEFGPGLTAITGETGAGKSLLVGALTFLAGGKPPYDVVRPGANHAIVEGEFSNSTGKITTIRRQLYVDGRSRAFVDDEPIGQKELAQKATSLLDITSQRAFSRLLDSRQHLNILDSFAGLESNRALLLKHSTHYHNLERRKKELERFLEEQQNRREFLGRQLAEIKSADPQEGEDEELAVEVRRLEHFEDLSRDGSALVGILSNKSDSVEIQLSESLKLLDSISNLDSTLADLKQDLEVSLNTVREVSRRVKERCRADNSENARLEELRQRQYQLTTLARRFGGSITKLLEKRAEIKRELAESNDAEQELDDVRHKLKLAFKEWIALAGKVSQHRYVASEKIEKKVSGGLAELGIGEPRFQVRFEQLLNLDEISKTDAIDHRLTDRGFEEATFYFSANAGIDPKPISTVASGGELSRVMLALKEALPLQSEEATILFDEIDTGVSGRTAQLVGKKMKKISAGRQLLVITHLPQIASLADQHLNVIKRDIDGVTFTEVKKLSSEQSINEIAVMLSGKDISEEAIRQAHFLKSE